MGEVKEFKTEQLTYNLDGNIYKMIKVEGGASGDFSIMQTELPPQSIIQIAGMEFGPLDSKRNDKIIIRTEWRSFINDLRNKTGLNFRLPTAEEWMYAAKGGNKSQGFTYCGSNNINDVAWYYDNSEGKIHPIAQKQPNELGLYDMSGNYGELTFQNGEKDGVDGDFYGGNYSKIKEDCKTTSMEKGSTSTGKIRKDSELVEFNAFDATQHTVRLIYERH